MRFAGLVGGLAAVLEGVLGWWCISLVQDRAGIAKWLRTTVSILVLYCSWFGYGDQGTCCCSLGARIVSQL